MSVVTTTTVMSLTVGTPMPPPKWAELERELLAQSGEACAEFFEKYFDAQTGFRELVVGRDEVQCLAGFVLVFVMFSASLWRRRRESEPSKNLENHLGKQPFCGIG